MVSYKVKIEREGLMVSVGTIAGENSQTARFCYDEEYIKSCKVPISLSLPLQSAPFSAVQTKNYFEGLLPEGFTRRSVAGYMHVDESDYLTILHGLGRECLGAVSITEEAEETEASYERISEKQVKELAAEGVEKSSEFVIKAHLSLTGASGKVGLYYDMPGNRWYLPRGTAPSTHIVKQSHIRLGAIVTNEQLSMLTAARCGISIPRSFIINTGEGNENEVLFATQRYDRVFSRRPDMISGLPRPDRLHQEDFAQAMGIPSAEKYENGQKGYMEMMFEILRKHSADPIKDQLKLWDLIIFHYLIGNTDAHIKNFSILHDSNLRTMRLAPAYDIVSTVVYEQCTRDMAFSIGDALSVDDISGEAFRVAARRVGIGEKIAMTHFEEMVRRFKEALLQSAYELTVKGYTKAPEIEGRILQYGGIKKYL